MIQRLIQNQCLALAGQYPVVTITGPRQSGKTTLAKACFPHKPYVNLEEPDQRKIAVEDPRGFLNTYPEGVILDEIQRTPELPSYIQSIVDSTRQNGMFILTGSQQFEISHSISQSLAGRTALIKLLPFSLAELQEFDQKYTLDEILFNGFYPRLHDQGLHPSSFFMNYFETYVQRDLRQLSQIEDLHLFEKFVRILASRIGQLLDSSSLANDMGLSHPTIRKWVSLLEASFIICLLPPFYRNIGKRLIKTPKVYFYDTGLASYLLGIETHHQLRTHPLRGYLFENFVIMEFLKQRFTDVKASNLYFFRDRTGHEVDLLLNQASRLIPVEIKSAETAQPDFSREILFLKKLFPNEIPESYVIFNGTTPHTIHGVQFLSWNDIHKIKN